MKESASDPATYLHPKRQPLRKPPALAKDFPPSTAQPSSYFHFTGVTPESTATVRRLIQENDRGYDMFEEKRRYAHNHFVHSLLARYSLGAAPALLQADWEFDRTHMAPLDPAEDGRIKNVPGLPDKLTRDNWADMRWLGKRDAFSRYLAFFHEEIARLGPVETINQYIFSPRANTGEGTTGPRVMVALLAGVVHPFIHLGYGLEFNDPVVMAEGLAQACAHSLSSDAALYPTGWPATPLAQSKGPSLPLIQLYAEFTNREDLHPGPYDSDILISDRLHDYLTPPHVEAIHDLVARWDLSDMTDAGWHERHMELGWLTSLLTGATTCPNYDIRVDFFLMHLLNSSHFIPAYMKVLSETHRRNLLQSYVMTMFQILATRGRPELFLDLVMSASATPHGPVPRAKDGPLQAVGDPHNPAQANPWLEIVDNALAAYDSHVPKAIRALVYYSQHLGWTPAGGLPGCADENGAEVIPGIGKVDGSVFVRMAGKYMDFTGWVKEGDRYKDFDRSALGWREAWEKDGFAQTNVDTNSKHKS